MIIDDGSKYTRNETPSLFSLFFQQVLLGTGAFVAWTVTSFLCHQSAKLFLRSEIATTYLDTGLVWAVVITLAQMTMCHLLVDLHLSDTRSSRLHNILRIKFMCHILATLATNYSMTLIDASSTFTIKLLEPVTSTIVQYFMLGTSLSAGAILSLPVIIGGAVTFCSNSINTSMSMTGIIMALISNVILAFRNVAIKIEQKEGSGPVVQLRGRHRLIKMAVTLVVLVCFVLYLASQKLLPFSVVFMTVTATSSSVFHVVYSYISTNIVLLYMSVISHSVANIFKRVLVVLLLYAAGQREATLVNFTGLVLCTVGLFLYVSENHKQNGSDSNTTSDFACPVPLKAVRLIGFFLLCCCVNIIGSAYISNTKTSVEPIWQNSSQVHTFMPETRYGPRNSPAFVSFLQKKLILTPTETNILSPTLNSSFDIIAEAQRVHMNLFSDIFANFKYAMLFDVAVYENKGDPAITVGEVYLLRRLGIELVYYCNIFACTDGNLNYAKELSKRYSASELIILLQGGGNMVGYKQNDELRSRVFKHFSNFEIVLFPQSIYLRNNPEHFRFCQDLYQSQDNFTMVFRDKLSLHYAQQYFKGKGTLMMAPDIAFQIGHVPRFISPSFDILWLKRTDEESPGYKLPNIPPDVSVHIADWREWKTPKGETSMESCFILANNGFVFVQRGRVVITDRLHGHILSTLSDIPHVLIDNKNRKLSSYHNTWTRGLANTVLADNATHALQLAMELLKKYDKVLPPIAAFMNVREKP